MANRRQPGWPVHGVLLLDKSAGASSNQALQAAKRLLSARKAGHTGSLDPIATGLLPLCFGDATKISALFLESDKCYWVKIQLGRATDTGDCEGQTIAEKAVQVSAEQLQQALQQFKGEIQQTPPMYSALKRAGQPLYKLARQGIEVPREPRPVNVSELNLLDWQGEEVELELTCSKGFYVRTLAADLGDVLGCGAHVSALRRKRVGALSVDKAVTLEQLELVTTSRAREKLLLKIDESLAHYPEIKLPENIASYFCRGQSVRPPTQVTAQVTAQATAMATDTTPAPQLLRVYSDGADFLGLAELQPTGKLAPKRLFCH